MFTKGEIFRMKEAEFQAKVLIPLFRAMKFRNVTPFDGRSLEKGKDIVMWEEGHLGERINYGVLVKAVKVSGKATGKNSASDILNQANQMLTSVFNDPVTTRKQEIQRCYVVSSKTISKEAIHSIESQLSRFNLDKVITFIHPDCNLFELIEKYLPEQSIFERLSSVQKDLDSLMENTPYRLVADSESKISISGKHDKATDEMPFNIKLEIEGKENLDKWNKHIRTGEPIEIEGKFTLPEFLPSFMKPDPNQKGRIIIEPIRSGHKIAFRIERKLDNGNLVILDNIQMETVQPGIDERTLKNDTQQVPWQITFVINFTKKSFNYEFVNKFSGFNVTQHLKSLQFFASLFEEGETSIFHADSGIKIVDSEKQKVEPKENFDFWLRLLEALVFIQQKTSVLFNLPERIITNEEVKNIYEIEQIIKNGKVSGIVSPFTSLTPLKTAKETIKSFENENPRRLFFRYQNNIKIEIWDKEVDLGVAVTTLDAFVKKEDFKKVQKTIEQNKDPIEIPFTPLDKPVIIDFLKWDCEDRHTRYQITDSLEK